jgi:beta-glucosidase-like glycosyl hydrolase
MDAQRAIARRIVFGLPPGGLAPAWAKDFSAYPPAGVIVFRRDFEDLESLRRLTARLRELARPRRIFVAIDEEGGWVSQLDGHLLVPPNALLLARGALPGQIETVSRVTGERLRALGVDWVFAPVVDVNVESKNPVIGPRAWGADAAAVSRCAGEALAGFRAAGIASCLKHFPGHGDTALDSHHTLPVCAASREVLDAVHLKPYRDLIGADAVMSTHVHHTALDPENPSTFSRAVMTDLLRGALGFQGVSITDALEMKGAALGQTPFDACRRALAAGCDLVMIAHWDDALRKTRLELAKALVDEAFDHAVFDAARPRLAAFDRSVPEPTAAEVSKPLDALTPEGWREAIEGIAQRGIRIEGALPAGAKETPWHVTEPAFARGETFADSLRRAGVAITESAAGAVDVRVVASRVPLPAAEIEALRAAAARGPLVLVSLQNDVVLNDVPGTAVRVSGADCTETTRRGVAGGLQRLAPAIT